MRKIYMFIAAALVAAACVKESSEIPEISYDGVVATIGSVEFDDEVATRTNVSTDLKFSWAEGDVIGIVPADSKTIQSNYEIMEIKSDPSVARFDGGSWALRDGYSYSAYYPCKNIVVDSEGTMVFGFTGQKQAANNDLSHFGTYDYMYAAPVTPQNGDVLFGFEHLVSIVKLTVPVASRATFTSLCLSADAECFATKARMDLSAGSLVAIEKVADFNMDLDDITVAAGGTLTVWLTTLPTELTAGKTFTLTVRDDEGNAHEYAASKTAKAFLQGKAYSFDFTAKDPNVVFSDDFSWLKALIDEYNGKNSNPIGNAVTGYADTDFAQASAANAPNAYTAEPFKSKFATALAAAGYTDLNAANKVIYPQDCYLKFGKTSVHTSLQFSPFAEGPSAYADYELSFDWCRHVQGTGKVDPVTLTVVIEGEGHFANGTKYSAPLGTVQPYEEGVYSTMGWNNSRVYIYGANPATKLNIVYTDCLDMVNGTYNWTVTGAHRYHIDNIKVSLKTGSEREPDPIIINPAAGTTVFGRVTCKGFGVEGVTVSDGYKVTTTNSEGVYELASDKASSKSHGYVFISVPSGYEAAQDGVFPKFWQTLTSTSNSVIERHDFELTKVNNDNHIMMVMGDLHLCNRTALKDKKQFEVFAYEFNQMVKDYKAAGKSVYALQLGDMTWDLYWDDNQGLSGCNFDLAAYKTYINQKLTCGVPLFHAMGNHDYDYRLTGDWETAVYYKQTISPTYYSFNIGGIHYIVIDDVICTNNKTVDNRGNKQGITDDQIAWVKEDMKHVASGVPVVVAMHMAAYNTSGSAQSGTASLNSAITSSGSHKIHYVTGDTHIMNHYGKITDAVSENNVGAVCGDWWWTGRNTSEVEFPGLSVQPFDYWFSHQYQFQQTRDGSPSGYMIYTMTGSDIKWQFKGTCLPLSRQFKTYDRNQFAINNTNYPGKGSYASTINSDAYSLLFYNFRDTRSDNTVFINVWNYDPSWTITVKENGTSLTVEQQRNIPDPMCLVTYNAARYAGGNSATSTFKANTTMTHIFKVTASSATSTLEITVKDGFGNTYTETMKRPKAFTIDWN